MLVPITRGRHVVRMHRGAASDSTPPPPTFYFILNTPQLRILSALAAYRGIEKKLFADVRLSCRHGHTKQTRRWASTYVYNDYTPRPERSGQEWREDIHLEGISSSYTIYYQGDIYNSSLSNVMMICAVFIIYISYPNSWDCNMMPRLYI